MEKVQIIRSLSEEFSNQLEHLEEQVFYWGIRKYKLDKIFDKEQGSYLDRLEGFPEGYTNFMASTWLFCRVLMDSRLLLQFSRTKREQMFPPQNALLKKWKTNPPFWSIFTVKERLSKNIFFIEDALSGQSYYCQSPSIEKQADQIIGAEYPIICPLFPLTETIAATYGMVRIYKGWYADDLIRLYRYMIGLLGYNGSFSSFILKHYGHFFQIDHNMESPVVMFKDQKVEMICTELNLPGFDPNSLNMEIEENLPFFRMTLKNTKNSAPGEILYNRESGQLFISSVSKAGYDRLCGCLAGCSLSDEPDFRLSLALYIAVDKHMDLTLPDDHWKHLFKKEETEDSPELESLNILLAEAVEAQNQGRSFDLYRRGGELGIMKENIDNIKNLLERTK